MANRTVKDAHSVRGTNPQYLVEKIIRSRIYECRYWKEHCFALTAELMVDKAMELKFIGGTFGGNVKPTPFICLILKMLQIQPEKDIVVEFIRNADFKYVRALGAIYMRLVGTSTECYKYLEPLYNDFRKIREQKKDGTFCVTHVDEFIDRLLREERECDIILPRIQKRGVLEEANELDPRVSALEDDLDDMEVSDEEEDFTAEPQTTEKRGRYHDHDVPRRSPSPRYRREPSPPRKRDRERERERERGDRDRGDRERDRDRDRDRGDRRERDRHQESSRHENRERRRSRSRERERDRSDRHRESGRHGRDEDERRGHRERKRHGDEREERPDKHRRRERDEDREIREANELRAKLGIQPLRP